MHLRELLSRVSKLCDPEPVALLTAEDDEALLEERRHWSRGRRALELLTNTENQWIHRRTETFSLEPSGETRQRIGWDFTVPRSLRVDASAGRVAVPLALMKKQTLKRLDVRDATGCALSIWGRTENGDLAKSALESSMGGIVGRELTPREHELLEAVVFASKKSAVRAELKELASVVGHGFAARALLALAQDLAANFILVVELPESCLGARTLVKLQHEGDIGTDTSSRLSTVHASTFEAAAWANAASGHIEVHAPPGLAIAKLAAEIDDGYNEDEEDDVDHDGASVTPAPPGDETSTLAEPRSWFIEDVSVSGHTAHISDSDTDIGSQVKVTLEVQPARPGLVNQTVIAAAATTALLTLALATPSGLERVLYGSDRTSALAAVTLAIPAFLVALLSRGPEHLLVSRLLLVPRMLNLAVALILLIASAVLALELPAHDFEVSFKALWACSMVALIWAGGIWKHAVGG